MTDTSDTPHAPREGLLDAQDAGGAVEERAQAQRARSGSDEADLDDTSRADAAQLVAKMRAMGLRCPLCFYDLRAAISARCPECGVMLTEQSFRIDNLPRNWLLLLSIIGTSALLVGAVFVAFVALLSMLGGVTLVSAGSFLLSVAMLAGLSWLLWWLAYRPLRALGVCERTPWAHWAFVLLLVLPGVAIVLGLAGAAITFAVFVLSAARALL